MFGFLGGGGFGGGWVRVGCGWVGGGGGGWFDAVEFGVAVGPELEV